MPNLFEIDMTLKDIDDHNQHTWAYLQRIRDEFAELQDAT